MAFGQLGHAIRVVVMAVGQPYGAQGVALSPAKRFDSRDIPCRIDDDSAAVGRVRKNINEIVVLAEL